MSGADPVRVAAGLKATIHNPRVSEEAKERAVERLHEMGSDENPKQNDTLEDSDSLTDNQIRGYKATTHNPRVSEEAKEHARQVLETHDASVTGESEETEGHDENPRVLAGYKATLKNPRVSEGAKQHAEQVLKDHDAI